MRILSFLFYLLLCTALLWVTSRPLNLGKITLPPPGAFFNPFSGFWQNGESDGLSDLSDELRLPGLSAPVQVAFDDLMTPHIFAQNETDLYRAQGYLTARDRLFQMDLLARRAGGRLSEVIGERALNTDRLNRRRGLCWAAERTLEAVKQSPETYKLMEAYTEGVNAYINSLSPKTYPIEYKLLHFKPEPWTVLSIALINENMAENLSLRESDLASSNTLELLGRENFDYLFPEWNPRQSPVIPDDERWKSFKPLVPGDSVPAQTTTEVRTGGDTQPKPSDPARDGSNNWAVSGSRTTTGLPMLANDPHLGFTLPSIWYQVQLHTPEFNCYGVALPGVPGVEIGFTEYIAWGVTNVSHDVADWYTLKWTDNSHTAYMLDGAARAVEMRIETILVRNRPTLYDTVRYTVWGPVVYDFTSRDTVRNYTLGSKFVYDVHPLHDAAFHWLSHEAPNPLMVSTFLRLSKAKNYKEYTDAVSYFDNPAQNIAFADKQGEIAIRPQGLYPVRRKEQGRFLLDGSSSANAWQGFIPFEQQPYSYNPARGYVSSANQHTTSPAYPYYYLGNFEDNRGRRINQRLERMQRVSVDSMKSIQLDNYSMRAADALPVMLRLLDRSLLDENGKNMVRELEAWRYTYNADETVPPLFEGWLDSLTVYAWDELAAFQKQKKEVLIPATWRLVELLEQDTNSIFFDRRQTPERENARRVVTQAFQSMEQYFTEHPDKRLPWGRFRPVNIFHLAQLDAFSRLNLNTGGHRTAPNAVNGRSGPSWRMVVALGDTVRAYGVFPGGQSGRPSSPYYDNMIDSWATGNYYELLLLRTPDENHPRLKRRIHLNPG